MRAPRLLAAGTAAVSLLLAGCSGIDKPTPIVSVVSGGRTVHSDATSFCFEGQDATKQPGSDGGCSFTSSTPQLLQVQAGDQIGVDVSKEVADEAWVVVLRSQAPGADGAQPQDQASPVQDSHYFAFSPQFTDGPLELQVRSLASNAPDARVTGVWRFVLAPE